MCGIAGIAGGLNQPAAASAVALMISTLERRGPDGDGLQVWNASALGHRRLAIFDLSEAGRQPMLSPDSSIGIVFNGAIYNFRDLRRELQELGYQFQSQTDTEVLVHGYREWGITRLAQRIRGMFAFGLWDDAIQRLFLVRDRLGVKPLVYAIKNDQLGFASTPRALRAAGFANEIDEQAVVDYLEFGFVTEARTIYQSIQRVPAASILEWSNEGTSVSEYWQPPASGSTARSTSIRFEDAVVETERLFLKAVEKRLFADVPVGSLLSGGVDSSLVCWALSQLGADITAYTVGTPLDASDETADARATANQLGIRHKIFNLSAEDDPGVSELVSAYSEPFACSSALGMLRISNAVSREAKVLLTGDGGDDVFLGYPEHRHLWLAQRFARTFPQSLTDKLQFAAGRPGSTNDEQKFIGHFGPLRRAASFLDYASGGLGAVTNAHDGLPAYRREEVLGERLMGFTLDQRNIAHSHESARNVLDQYLDYDRHTRFVSEFLTKVDGATMHYGLEARSPFLDQELWEFAASLPFSVRLRHGRPKAILRELARRRIGERVSRGSKRGFTIPVQKWMTGKWRSQVADAFRNPLIEEQGWIKPGAATRWLDRSAETGSVPKQLWYLFVLEAWLKHERQSSVVKKEMAGELVNLGA